MLGNEILEMDIHGTLSVINESIRQYPSIKKTLQRFPGIFPVIVSGVGKIPMLARASSFDLISQG